MLNDYFLAADHQGNQLELLQQFDKKGMPISITTAGALPVSLSYGRTQFVSETFLGHLNRLIPTLNADQMASLRLNSTVRLPNGNMGTIAHMVELARDRADAAAKRLVDFEEISGLV